MFTFYLGNFRCQRKFCAVFGFNPLYYQSTKGYSYDKGMLKVSSAKLYSHSFDFAANIVTVADPAAGYGGAEKHEIYVAAFVGHLFYDLFSQGRGGPMAPSPPGSATV